MADRRRRRGRTGAKSAVAANQAKTFGDLYFGQAAAENEVAADPERFRRTYFDRWSLSSKVDGHERFLFLGPKGAGKSAASWYVGLNWQERFGLESVFTTSVDFDELNRTQSPLSSLDKKLVSEEINNLTDAAWKLFLSVRILDSLLGDPACSLSRDPQALRLLSELRAAGLASDDYPHVLRRVRERKGMVRIPKIAEGGVTSREVEELSPGQVGDALVRLIMNANTPNRHLLAIDGLDKAITGNDSYWQTLAALIRVADSFRRLALHHRGSHVYVIVMCRSDVFRHARFADAPKIASDSAIHIEWHAEAADVRNVLLWEYLARKAEVSQDELFGYLPQSVRVGKQGAVESLRYLLSFTRYTPRDITQLFNSIGDWGEPDGAVNGERLRGGADRFATNHLLSEIIAESVGLLPPRVTNALDGIVGGLPSRVFTLADLEQSLEDSSVREEIAPRDLGEYLFLQGAIGNYNRELGYTQFYHRRDTYKFSRRGPYVLHTGLVYALNVPWSGV